jgi:Interferon-induced transmembrane protein
MKCPNCSAELNDQVVECDFCGEKIKPAEPPTSSKAVFTSSEPTYAAHPPIPERKPANPYNEPYPEPEKSYRNVPQFSDVPNHLVWAILSTLCCCIPTGIVAIVYAAQVNSKLAGGDYYGAQESSDNAKMWSLISFGLGILGAIISIIVRPPGDYPN